MLRTRTGSRYSSHADFSFLIDPTTRPSGAQEFTRTPQAKPRDRLCPPAQSEHPVIVAVGDDEVTAGTHADAVGAEDFGGEGIGWNESVTLLTGAHDGGEGGGFGVEAARLVPTDPLATQVFRPHGVRMGPGGDLVITDSYNHRVLRLRRQT